MNKLCLPHRIVMKNKKRLHMKVLITVLSTQTPVNNWDYYHCKDFFLRLYIMGNPEICDSQQYFYGLNVLTCIVIENGYFSLERYDNTD